MSEHTIESEGTRETLSVEQAARLLGIGRNNAYDAIHRGELPALKFGRRLVVPKQALRALLAGAEPVGVPHPAREAELERR